MSSDLSAAPVLSTPAEHTFLEEPVTIDTSREKRPDAELFKIYEISRTAAEIRARGWKRVALQFPDAMLADAPWVVEALNREIQQVQDGTEGESPRPRFYILADTSYSACCVDEIAAEHADADSVVHYGRACLSPTSRLSVLHIFTRQNLDHDAVATEFARQLTDKEAKFILMADVMFQEHVSPACALLKSKGYDNVVATEIIHDPSAPIPNRRTLDIDVSIDTLREYSLFHISSPPTALLLTLSSRLASLCIYPTPSSPYTTTTDVPDPSATPSLLRRRYALVIKLATASIIGILVNTLSVKNYMSTISTLRERIAAAGKKSYTIVVGKLNAAKLANFAEIDGWVVVGCWESGLVDQDSLWKPVVTPFEMDLALQSEENRIWTGEWWGGIEGVKTETDENSVGKETPEGKAEGEAEVAEDVEGGVSDDESEPPVFDLRTGKLVSHSRPMRLPIRSAPTATNGTSMSGAAQRDSSALVTRAPQEIALVNGVASPGAEFLRSKRTWQGLGTDFNLGEDDASTVIEEGRSGIARGYAVGAEPART
ncbi:putative diphthamide synthesis protein-domain-containing protein [Xylariaceae sp. FL1019]|nr:putative diphthamide synthesis protein-domain-containing protein [Xylariaceae sp. FL1019]